MVKIVRSQVLALNELGYGQSCLAIDYMHKREIAFRTKDLRLIDKTRAQQIASVVVEGLWTLLLVRLLTGQ
jgi:hypothetical protein